MGLSLEEFYWVVKTESDAKRITIRSLCNSLVRKHFEILSDGKVVTQTGEAGGSVQFQFTPGSSPTDVVKLAVSLLRWIEVQTDPDNPPIGGPRRITRFRAVFNRARL